MPDGSDGKKSTGGDPLSRENAARGADSPDEKARAGDVHADDNPKEMHTTEPAKEDQEGGSAPTDREPQKVPERHTIALFVVAIVLVVIPILGVVLFLHSRHARDAKQSKDLEAAQAKGPEVLVSHVTMSPPKRAVTLPADTRAILATTLYAKTSGYVVDIKTDKGFHCKKGDVLAILQSPEVDQQVAEARADLDVKQRNTVRNDELAKNGIVSEQVRDQAAGDYRTAVANLRQKEVLSGYEIIRAPFDGIVTARYVDPGALVPAATGSTESAMPVVDVAKIDTIKAVVYLGQDIAAFVRENDDVKLWQDEHPKDSWGAKITRLAGTLDPRTRTELAEIWFDNREHNIPPGVYLHAEISIAVSPSPVVSNEAIIVRGGQSYVAVIQDDVAHLVMVTTGYSDGRNTQVIAGLQGNEVVAMNAPPEVVDGSKVQSVEAPPQPPSNL